MAELEIERKFVVKFPKSWDDLLKLFNNLVDVKRISQTYLQKEDDGQSPRVRKTVEGFAGNTKTVYHYNKKHHVEKGVNKEEERTISKSQYEKYLKKSLKDKVELSKIRFVFNYNDQIFELDVFIKPISGLAILELELKDKNQKIELPPFLRVIKEVTGNKKFNNYSLADKKYLKE